jgi:hypothetical protein
MLFVLPKLDQKHLLADDLHSFRHLESTFIKTCTNTHTTTQSNTNTHSTHTHKQTQTHKHTHTQTLTQPHTQARTHKHTQRAQYGAHKNGLVLLLTSFVTLSLVGWCSPFRQKAKSATLFFPSQQSHSFAPSLSHMNTSVILSSFIHSHLLSP